MEKSVHFSATSLKNLFEHVDPSAITNFIKDRNFNNVKVQKSHIWHKNLFVNRKRPFYLN